MFRGARPTIRWPRSLRAQLTLIICLFSAMPPLFLAGLGFVAFRNHVLPEHRAYLAELAGSYCERTESLLGRRREEIADIERGLGREQHRSDHREALLREIGGHPAFASLALVGANGRVLASTIQGVAGETSRYADLAAEALTFGASTGVLTNDVNEGGLVVPLAVRTEFTVAGAELSLVATLPWSDLFSVVEGGAVLDPDGRLRRFVVLIESTGRVLAAPAALIDRFPPLGMVAGLVAEDRGLEPLFEGATFFEIGGLRYRAIAGQHSGRIDDANDAVCGNGRHCQIASWPATAVMFEDASIALAPVKALLLRGALVVCLVIALSAQAGRFFSKRITAQLEHLTQASEAIAEGRSIEMVPITTDDEIGTLTDHFNHMSAALTKSRTILEQHAANLEDTNLKLRELDETRTQLLANVSHEMRTPISAMISAARIIHRYHSEKPEAIPRFSRVIVEEGQRLSTLVNQALDLAALESHGAEWNDELVDIGRLIIDTVEDIKPLAQSRDVRIDCESADHLPQFVADAERLEQVIRHLVDNAITFTPGGGQIAVRSSFGNDQLQIEVEDDGIGIATDDLDKIFEAFHQVQDADPRRDKPVGSGLGLAICRDIISRYGGEIVVDSTLGRGSTFRVILPLDGASAAITTTTQLS